MTNKIMRIENMRSNNDNQKELYRKGDLNSVCRLLYYPKISIPNTAWLAQAVLYWDGLTTIVPTDYLKYPERFSRFARDLVKEGIVQTIQPEAYAYSYVHEYMQFLEWVERYRDKFLLSISNDDCPTVIHNLHTGKLGYIGSELERMGVARRINERWYETSESLSMSFMTFLAVLISQKENYIPMTDSYGGMSALFGIGSRNSSNTARRIRNETRNAILDGLLPAPYGIKDYCDLLRFKEHYHDELIRFRRRIEDFVLTIDSIPVELRQERIESFLLFSKDEISEIKGHMSFFQVPRIDIGTLVGILPSAYYALQGNFENAALGMIPVVGEMFWNRDRRMNRRKPLAYAALFQGRFRNHIKRIEENETYKKVPQIGI